MGVSRYRPSVFAFVTIRLLSGTFHFHFLPIQFQFSSNTSIILHDIPIVKGWALFTVKYLSMRKIAVTFRVSRTEMFTVRSCARASV